MKNTKHLVGWEYDWIFSGLQLTNANTGCEKMVGKSITLHRSSMLSGVRSWQVVRTRNKFANMYNLSSLGADFAREISLGCVKKKQNPSNRFESSRLNSDTSNLNTSWFFCLEQVHRHGA